MALTYTVNIGNSTNGPWKPVPGSPFPSTSGSIAGLAAATTYYFEIITNDTLTGLASSPVISGPFTTSSAGPTESAEGTTVTTTGQSILASQTPGSPAGATLDTWTLTAAGGSVDINGSAAGFTQGVIEIYYHNHTVYQEANAANSLGLNPGWWQWSGTAWVDCASPVPLTPTVNINTVTTQSINVAFAVSGTLQNYAAIPTLQYQDNQAGTWINLPTQPTTTSTFSFTHPAVATASTTMTVGVRDANTTSIVALSNTFAVVVPGQITLTGITLAGSSSNVSFQSNPAIGAVIGTIAVQTTGGSFNGTLALSGTNASQFQISGTNLVVNSTGLSGSYSVTITATMSGAVGSPQSTLFTLTAVNSNLTVNLASLNGKNISPHIWGFCIGGVAYGYSNSNSMDVMLDAKSLATMAKIPASCIRSNCQQTAPIHAQVFANGTASPDWTVIDRWINNHSGFFNDATGRFVWGIGENANDTTNSPATWATWAPLIAQHFKNAGQEIFYWEIGNEISDINLYLSYFNPIADALHAFNSSYLCGGPAANQIAGQFSFTDFANAVGTKLGFLTFHQYNDSLLDNSIYQEMVGWNFTQARNALASTPVPNIPIGFLEYNLTDYAAQNTSLYCPIGLGLQMVNAYKNDPNFTMGAIWDYVGVNSAPYPVIGNSNNDGVTIDPMGWYLGAMGQKMNGAEVAITDNTGSGNFQTLACKNPNGTWAIHMINYNIGGNPINASLGIVGGNAGAAVTVWQLSAANLNSTTFASTLGSNVSCPSESITIVTGTYS